MSLSQYFEEHEEQAFVAKALATAVGIILVKNYLSGLVSFLLLVAPVVCLIGIRMHAAATGVGSMELLREHITFFPMMRSEADRVSEVKTWVTYGIILANVVIFYGFEMRVPQEVIEDLLFLPKHPDLFNVPISAFTSIFLHASGGHLWGNMTFLWVVGTAVERRVGRLRFFWLYLLTGLLGGIVFVLVEYLFHGKAGHALGASGAIAGIMGIFAVRCYFKSMIFPLPILGIFSLILPLSLKIRLNSLVIMALFFLSDLSGGLAQIAGKSESMVGHWAHLGGMVSGMLIAGYLKLGEDAVEERHLEIGVKAAEARIGYADGARSLQIALERSPDNIDALLALARIRTKFSQDPEGKEAYEKALALVLAARPAEVVDLFAEYYRKFLTVPADPALVARLAEALLKGGDVERAVECLDRLVKMEDTPRALLEKSLFQLATLLEFTSRFEAATAQYARFAAEFPDSVLAEKARQKAGDARPAPAAAHPGPTPAAARICRECGAQMVRRTATSGVQRGKDFWVCGSYPSCRYCRPVEEPAEAVEAMPLPQPLPERYRLVLDGTIPFTSDPEETRENVMRLFRCDRERVDRLFGGGRTVVKRGLDHATALRYKEALDRAGAVCTLEAEEKAAPAAPPAQAAPAAKEACPPPAPSGAPAAAPQPTVSCPKCGWLQEKGEACARCGVYFAKLAGAAERDFQTFRERLPGGAAYRGMSELQERRWAAACHLSALSGIFIPFGNLLGPLVVWLWKRRESEFVDYHGKVALNYQITLALLLIGATIVAAFTGFAMLFVLPLSGLLGIYTLYVVVDSAARSNRGEDVEIALCADFIK